MPCCGCGGGSGGNSNDNYYCSPARCASVYYNGEQYYYKYRRKKQARLIIIRRSFTATLCLPLLVALICCFCGAAAAVGGHGDVSQSGRIDFLAAVLSLCPPSSSRNVTTPPGQQNSGSAATNVVDRSRRSAQLFELQSNSAGSNRDRVALTQNLPLIRQLCPFSSGQESEAGVVDLLDSLSDRLASGLYRVPNCRHLSVASVLPQFDGCSELINALSIVGHNSTAAEAAHLLACDCIDQLMNASANMEIVLADFHALVDRIYFTKSSMDRSAHQKRMQACQDVYRDWLCSVKFNVYNINNSLTQVNPCSEWCQSVETECPYLTPSEDFSNAGEPVFLCHEDSYKGTSVSDRCTGATQCCCYAPTNSSRTDIEIICTASSIALARQRGSASARSPSTAGDPVLNGQIDNSTANSTNITISNSSGLTSAAAAQGAATTSNLLVSISALFFIYSRQEIPLLTSLL